MPGFIPGLELARALFEEAVEPLLAEEWPRLEYGAALIGPGSDVLGFDTEMSMDHGWGPRLQLFVSEADAVSQGATIVEMLRQGLPLAIRGFPVNFSAPEAAGDSPIMTAIESGPVNHHVVVHSLSAYLRSYVAVDLDAPVELADWLTLPQQKLRSLTAGVVFREGGGLGEMRERFTYFPRDAWLYQLASGWARIGEDEHLLGRAGFLGDELGAQIIAARLAHTVMRLCFLLERTYAPYAKWLGTAFGHLACASDMSPLFGALLSANDWRARDAALVPLLEWLSELQNAAGVAASLESKATPFFERPFHVIFGDRFAQAIRNELVSPEARRLSQRRLIGGIDQVTEDTALLEDATRRESLMQLYR